jgi:uncharacterized protein YgiM (DUF1202 family)
MEETAVAQPNQQMPQSKTGQFRKKIFLIVFVGIALIIALFTYFLLVASKPTTSNNQKEKVSTNSATPTTKTDETNQTLKIVYVTALEGLNLREEASTDSLVTLLLPFGTELKVISTEGDWYFVQAQTKGFVHKDYVSETKPTGQTLLTFENSQSAFKFLYPDLYKVSLTKADNVVTYNFIGNQSLGGFKVETQENMATLGNYAITKYPEGQKTSCEPVRFGTQAKECEKVTDSTGTTYLLLVNTTLYKITYLKTEGGLLTDLNNLVFYSMYFD